MMIMYKVYDYSVKATLLANLRNFGAIILAAFGIVFIFEQSSISKKIIGILLVVAAVVLFFLLKNLPDKIAEEDFDRKIRSNAKFAYRYCCRYPERYEAVCEVNQEFAENYYVNEKNKIVKYGK